MFDKLNIFINNEQKEEEKPKNIFMEIFSDKYEITFVIYLIGVSYQILKLIGGLNNPNFGNLMFFSFSNSINDFLIILGFTLLIFLSTIIILFIPAYAINGYQRKKLKYSNWVYFLILLLSSSFLLIYTYIRTKISVFSIIILFLYYIFSCVPIYYILKGAFSKKIFYIVFLLLILVSFFLILYDGEKYYGCEKMTGNRDKDCILIDYKNDKYGFTGNGDIYDLANFKSFYTSNYFKNQTDTGSTKN